MDPIGEGPQTHVVTLVPGAGLDLPVADVGPGVEFLRGPAEAQVVDLESGRRLAQPHTSCPVLSVLPLQLETPFNIFANATIQLLQI